MQVDLKDEGTFVFTGDQFHVKENYTLRQPQGMILRLKLYEDDTDNFYQDFLEETGQRGTNPCCTSSGWNGCSMQRLCTGMIRIASMR